MKYAKSLQQSAIGYLSFALTSFSPAKADNLDENDDFGDAKSYASNGIAIASLVGAGITAEKELVQDVLKINEQSLGKAFKNNTVKHNLLSVVGGVSTGVVAWLLPFFNFNQAKLMGLAVTAFDMTLSEIKLLGKAKNEMPVLDKDEPTRVDGDVSMHDETEQDQQFAHTFENSSKQPFLQGNNNINSLPSDAKVLSSSLADQNEDVIDLAKFIRKNSTIKLFATYALGIGLEAVMNYAVKNLGNAEPYVSNEDVAIGSAIATNLIWSAAARIAQRNSPALVEDDKQTSFVAY